MSLLRRKSKHKESPSTSAQGSVSIPNRDPYLLEYKENLTVKDVVDGVCRHLELLPVTWPFFGICLSDTKFCLYPYDVMSAEDCTKQYTLRVIVNVGPNCFHFKYLDDKAFNFFFDQVKQDFIAGRLDGMALDYMYWMAGIDMVRKAQEEKTDYKGLMQKYSFCNFLPVSCLRKMKRTRKVVVAAFDKFYNSVNPLSDGKLKLKYLEIAEKSSVLEYHTCQAAMDTDSGKVAIKLWISVKKGIEKEVLVNDSSPPQSPQSVCQLADIDFIETSYRTVGQNSKWIAKVVYKQSDAPAQVSGQREYHFIFNKKEELVSFCIVVDTLYVLTINCNACILEGSLKPPERYLKITEKDPVNNKICHGLISRDAVHSILSEEGMENGLYLVRKSRQRINSFTLHVCLNNRVRNFEIKMNNEGKLSILPNAAFESLLKLVYYYHKDKHGLPVPLMRILPPEKTGPIPLLDKDPKTLKGHASTSPDAVDTSSPAFPFNGETSGSSTSSESSGDSGLPNNHDTIFDLPLLPGNGIRPKPLPLSNMRVENGMPSFNWEHKTLTVSSNESFLHPNPAPPTIPSILQFPLTRPLPHQSPILPTMNPSSSSTSNPLNMSRGAAAPEVKAPVHTIAHTQLKRGRELGQGHFSHVYKGEYTDDQQRTQPVAIKVLKKKSMPEDGGVAEAELLKEADNMAALNHKHIVKFLGISHSLEDELMLITEFLPCGDLRKYLKKYKERQDIPINRLLKFSNQIAEGMSYLESKRIVHRDLAARNVLVLDDNCVKISDFGLARQLNLQKNSDYYRVHDPRNASLPLWWYAPESIYEWKFTSANDVWSFGVTLWEIFSYGGTPKLEEIVANDRMEIYQHLVNGKRLKRPNNCPEEVYQLMKDHCWNINPNSRMKFDRLSVELMFIQNRS